MQVIQYCKSLHSDILRHKFCKNDVELIGINKTTECLPNLELLTSSDVCLSLAIAIGEVHTFFTFALMMT